MKIHVPSTSYFKLGLFPHSMHPFLRFNFAINLGSHCIILSILHGIMLFKSLELVGPRVCDMKAEIEFLPLERTILSNQSIPLHDTQIEVNITGVKICKLLQLI